MFAFRLIHPCFIVQLRFVLLGEFGFDQTPSLGKIGIISRKRPDAMHVIGQQHPSLDDKGIVSLCSGNCVSQGKPVLRQGKEFPAPVSYHGKKVSCAFGFGAAIVRHVFLLPFMGRGGRCPPLCRLKSLVPRFMDGVFGIQVVGGAHPTYFPFHIFRRPPLVDKRPQMLSPHRIFEYLLPVNYIFLLIFEQSRNLLDGHFSSFHLWSTKFFLS